MVVHRAEGARIGEREAAIALEVEGDARMTRQCGRRARDLPVAVETEVHEERRAVVEMQELVLAAARDVVDATADDAAQDGRSERAALRPVMDPCALDALASHRAPQATDGELDFGQFRHFAPPKRGTTH